MKLTLITLILTYISLPLFSLTKADSLYTTQNYKEAATEYETLLSEGINDELFYNLGNCYFRMNEFPQAILNYQKALKMNPHHEEAFENLRLCLEKVGAQEYIEDELFYTTWLKSLVGSKNANEWGIWALVCWGIFLLMGVVYFLSYTPLVKKIAFFTALLLLLVAIMLNVFAYNSKKSFYTTLQLVVMKTTPLYESATNASKQIGEVPAGVLLKLNENFNDSWYNVSLPDGRKAWCEKTTIEKVELTKKEK